MGERVQEDGDSKAIMDSFMAAHKEEVQQRRESREVPEDAYDLVEYFLDTEAPDMAYEVARCRPKLDDEFFTVLNKLVGTLFVLFVRTYAYVCVYVVMKTRRRQKTMHHQVFLCIYAGMEQLSPAPDEERLAELEMLRDYLKEAVEAVDNATKQVTAAPERLKKLIESKNKKETLLQMAGDNEIDQAFMDLLEQNIEGAQEAGRDDVVEFMTKIRQAAGKYLISQ